MPKGGAQPGAGRPKGSYHVEIDWKQFEKLCSIMATRKELAGWFRIAEQTLKDRVKAEYGKPFNEVWDDFSSDGKISLRRSQIEMSKKNPTLLIWLGKQHLGQTDKNDINENSTQKIVLAYNLDESIDSESE